MKILYFVASIYVYMCGNNISASFWHCAIIKVKSTIAQTYPKAYWLWQGNQLMKILYYVVSIFFTCEVTTFLQVFGIAKIKVKSTIAQTHPKAYWLWQGNQLMKILYYVVSIFLYVW